MLKAPILCEIKNPPITDSPSHTDFLCIRVSASTDSTNCGLCTAVAFAIGKSLHVSGSTQFQPLLFKGQLYVPV